MQRFTPIPCQGTMTLRQIVFCFCCGILLSSCSQDLYYQHSRHTATTPYRAMPLRSDSVRSAFYAGISYTGGESNVYFSDNNNAFTATAHGAWNLGPIQAFAGTDLSAGNYRIKLIDSILFFPPNPFPNRAAVNSQQGRKGYGAWGLHLGVNAVIPFPTGGEWRVVGVEYYRSQDWGGYAQFRKNLPDSAVNVLQRSNVYQTLSLTTEVAFKLKEVNFGYKAAMGAKIGKLERFDENGRAGTIWPGNLSQTVQVTKQRFTGYLQFNTGYRAYSFMLGSQFRLR